jgi:transposase
VRYTEQQKLLVVQDYMAGNGGQKVVAQRHGVDVSALRSWIAAYREHGAAGIAAKVKRPRYSPEFKLAVLARLADEGLSCRQAAALYDIRRFDLVATWQRRYDEGGFAALCRSNTGAPRTLQTNKPPKIAPRDDRRSREELLAELEQLRMENAYLKKLGALVQAKRSSASKKRR